MPAGSNYSCNTNFGDTVKFAKKHIAPERLKGFLQTIWRATTPKYRDTHLAAIEQVARAREKLGS